VSSQSSELGGILSGASFNGRTSDRAVYQFTSGRSAGQLGIDFQTLSSGGRAGFVNPNGTMSFSRGMGDGLAVTFTMRGSSSGSPTLEARFTQSGVPTGSRIARDEHVLTIKVRYGP
jgi:hypothetical protein